MDLPNQVDVLIVGAGPVGATMANLCGRLNVTTLMIDTLPEIQNQPRAIALDNEALRILQLAGLDESAFSRVVIPEVRLHSPIFGQFARMNTNSMIDGHPMLITFYQPELEQALHRALTRYPCVQVARPVVWIKTEEVDDGCVCSLRMPDGSVREIRTNYVVGADGASSPVRNSLGIGFSGSTYQEDWLIVDVLNAEKNIEHIEFFCDPRRPVPHMPAPAARQRWEFMLHPGETKDDMLQEEKIRQLLKPWANLNQVEVERKAVYRFHARTASQFKSGRTLLIGDAAHVTPPFIGQGLVAGLRDTANLAWKLASVVQGRSNPRILESYHTERQPHARAMIRLARWMGKLVMPRNGLAAFIAHGTARLMTLTPGLKQLIVDIKIKPKNRFTHGLFAPRSRADRFEHGNHLVQGRLRNSKGIILQSDDVLGPELQLVGIGIDPMTQLSKKQIEIWRSLGGRSVTILAAGSATVGKNAWIDIDNAFGTRELKQGWIIATRPDKVIMADGDPAGAGHIINAVEKLLR
jgi:3-(3-hydroxy-phenyl)propionate hydroxylase